MNKQITAIVLAVVLIAGAVFASVAFLQEDVPEESKTETIKQLQQTCDIETCNWQCGGNCGIPTCGCSR
jgi:hypothetical protein